MTNPLKQGLKLKLFGRLFERMLSRNDESTKTRIETRRRHRHRITREGRNDESTKTRIETPHSLKPVG